MLESTGLRFALALYYLLQLCGGIWLCALLLRHCFKNVFDDSLLPLIGFSAFPLFVTYAGFLGIGKWNIAIVSAGLGLAVAGGLIIVRMGRRAVLGEGNSWKAWLLPAIILGAVLLAKSSHWAGGISHTDESRSIMLTAAFATNGLKPAFHFDFSLPIVYPYLAFESSAFLYASVRGISFPSIPVLVVGLATNAAFFYGLWLLTQNLQSTFKSTRSAYNGIVLLLIFSSLTGLQTNAAQNFGSTAGSFPIQPIGNFLHSGYHYLLGTVLGICGIILLERFLRRGNNSDWIQFVVLMGLSAGWSGIPFSWLAFAAMLRLILYLAVNRGKAVRQLVKKIPASFGLFGVIQAPQLFNFLPRGSYNFHFSSPHLWFTRMVDYPVFHSGRPITDGLAGLLSALRFVGEALLVTIGPFLVSGLVFALWVLWKRLRRGAGATVPDELFAIAFATMAVLLLLTCTISSAGDWASRGFAVPTVLSALLTAAFSQRFAQQSALLRVGAITVLVPFVLSFAVEQGSYLRDFNGASERARFINQHFPLGTIFYDHRSKTEAARQPQGNGDMVTDVIRGGRAILTANLLNISYLNHPSVLMRLGAGKLFKPCTQALFGRNVPAGGYVEIVEGNFVPRSCPSG